MTKTDKRNERRGGFYWIEGKPYVSVTNVLKVIDKPALRYWFGKEVYYALAKDPSLGEKEALSAPYSKSKEAMDRGTTVHSIVEVWKQSKKHIETIPNKYKGYGQAFYSWIKDYKMEIQEHERTVFHPEFGYAGTLDMLAKNNGDTWVIDVKTGKDIYKESHLQISAYQAAIHYETKVEHPDELTRGGVLLLQEDGKYKFAEVEDCFDQFMSAKVLWEWINKDTLEKVGYEK
jgi:hypothetical protein